MEQQQLIDMLNRDLADEHAAILRYLAHSYLEGEDTPLGAGLLSRAREEMWHMHWLGMVIGSLGGEIDFTPAPYPFDPTSRESIFKSYVAYEQNLIPHYLEEAEKVSDPHIRRVLQRESWESEIHARKFQKTLDKLTPEQASGLPGEENELPENFVEQLQQIVAFKYTQTLQSIRDAWVFQKDDMKGWQIMDFSMTQMKQLAHMAENVAENGLSPRLEAGRIETSAMLEPALSHMLKLAGASRELHDKLNQTPETQKHKGLVINVKLGVQQDQYQSEEVGGWLKK